MQKIRKRFFSTALICLLTLALAFTFVAGCGKPEGAKVESKEEALKKLQTLSDEDQKPAEGQAKTEAAPAKK
jgi:hypothetical protein